MSPQSAAEGCACCCNAAYQADGQVPDPKECERKWMDITAKQACVDDNPVTGTLQGNRGFPRPEN
jgi:hypothetical protein